MGLPKLFIGTRKARHVYMPATPHVALEFAYAAGLFRMRQAANSGGFVDTGRPNSVNTPRFFPIPATLD